MFLIKMSVRLVLLSGVLYLVFFVPLAERTLYQHFARIAATQEVQDLGQEVDGVVGSAAERAQQYVVGPVNDLVERSGD